MTQVLHFPVKAAEISGGEIIDIEREAESGSIAGTEATIEYDALNRPVKYILPNGSTQTAEYVIDAAHKESYTIFTDSAGVKYKNVYDGIGRIKAKYRAEQIGIDWKNIHMMRQAGYIRRNQDSREQAL